MPPPSKTPTTDNAPNSTGIGRAKASRPPTPGRTPGRRDRGDMRELYPWGRMCEQGSNPSPSHARKPASKSPSPVPTSKSPLAVSGSKSSLANVTSRPSLVTSTAKPSSSKHCDQQQSQPEGRSKPASSPSLRAQNTKPSNEGGTNSPVPSPLPTPSGPRSTDSLEETVGLPISSRSSALKRDNLAIQEVNATRKCPAVSHYAVGQVNKPLPACPVEIQYYTDDQPGDGYLQERPPARNARGVLVEFTGFSNSSIDGLREGSLSRLRYIEPNRQTGLCDFDLCLTHPSKERLVSDLLRFGEGVSKPKLGTLHWGRESEASLGTAGETFLHVDSWIEVKQLFNNLTPNRHPEASLYEICLDQFPRARTRTQLGSPGMKWFWDCTFHKLESRHELSLRLERSDGECETVLTVLKRPTQQRHQHQFEARPFSDREWSKGFDLGVQSKEDEFRDFLSLILLFPALLWNGALKNATNRP